MTAARDARGEAQEVVGPEYEARVLEPSPPAVDDGEWFADDPVAVGGASRPVVSPVGNGALTWSEWLTNRPECGGWAADRWLAGWRRLEPAPRRFAETRLALHRLAVYVMSPARRRANGKIALRWTLGGFGTPFFGADEQVRVVGADLVRQRGGDAKSAPVTTLAEAAAFVLDGPPDVEWAAEFDVPEPGDLDAPLDVDPEAAAFLGDWFGFATSVLEEVRAEPASAEAGRVQLWAEHFDAAFECLSDGERRRAGFGASPGDSQVGEPYLYVVPWYFDDVPRSRRWNADSFKGAVLPLSELVGAGVADAAGQRRAALDFYRECRAVLTPP